MEALLDVYSFRSDALEIIIGITHPPVLFESLIKLFLIARDQSELLPETLTNCDRHKTDFNWKQCFSSIDVINLYIEWIRC